FQQANRLGKIPCQAMDLCFQKPHWNGEYANLLMLQRQYDVALSAVEKYLKTEDSRRDYSISTPETMNRRSDCFVPRRAPTERNRSASSTRFWRGDTSIGRKRPWIFSTPSLPVSQLCRLCAPRRLISRQTVLAPIKH